MRLPGTQAPALVLRCDNRRSTAAGALRLLRSLSLVAACGGGSKAGADRGASSPTSCPQRLAPVPAAGQTATLGSGTAARCTEQVLRTALANVKAAGGGTVPFDCGGSHTIMVGSALPVGSAKDQTVIVDGNGQITISGGGTWLATVGRLFAA